MLNGTPSQKLNDFKFDLQLFSDGAVDPVPTDPTPQDPMLNDPVDPAIPADPQPTDPIPQTIKVKYNHEEREIPLDEAIQLAQKGMNYDKAVERAQQAAKDEFIASHGYVNPFSGEPITTEAQYREALEQQEEYERRVELEQSGVDPSVVDEYVENNPVVKWAKDFKQQQEAEQFKQTNQGEFLNWFKENNGRPFDVNKDQIPNEIWQEVDRYEKSLGREGKSLIDAYVKHENQLLKAKIAEYEKGIKADEANKANANASPGSLTGQGATGDSFITMETFEANKHDNNWVNKNFNKIMESRAKW